MAQREASARLSWHIENAAAPEAELWVYDVIGGDGFWEEGVSSIDFCKEVRGITASRINLHVNSPGGYVTDAIAMFNALQSHPAEVVAYIEGSADSAASFLIQAADSRIIAKNASMTIHEGHAMVAGPASKLRAFADQLEAESQNIASIYADRCGGTAQEWRDRMLANGGTLGTTYRGQGAVDIGLCDEVGIASRNAIPSKIAALFRPTAQTDSDSTPSVPATGLGEALRAARLDPIAPTLKQLESLFEQSPRPLTAAFGKGG